MNRQLILCIAVLTVGTVSAQTYEEFNRKPEAYRARFLGITPPLGKIPVATQLTGNRPSAERENFSRDNKPVVQRQPALDPVLQNQPYNLRGGNPLQVINDLDGLDETLSTIYPADPNGDIGANHYIQMVNASDGMSYGALINIYDKSGTLVYGPTFSSGLWTSLGQVGTGDPIVLYDHDADRWLLTELSVDWIHMLVAVSVSSDPLGAWYAYQFSAPDLPDYPKYALWPNAYLVTTNEGGWSGFSPVYAFDRQAMINGDTSIKVLRFEVPAIQAIAIQMLNAVDWDGPLAPTDPDPIIFRLQDDAWGLVSQDQIEMWKLHIDWANLGNSQLNGPDPIPVSSFDASACDWGGWYSCVPQPGGWLSALDGFLLYRVYYRKFPTYEAMVCCHLADVDGLGHVGIRWYELRKAGSTWQVFDEGTYAPDSLHRVHASIGIDASGSIALGYMRTGAGPNDYPSLCVTGRRQGDQPGMMTIPETVVGPSSYMNLLGRSGDYSSMTVDPMNQAEFWYTGQYFPTQNLWSTRITSFRIQSEANDVGPITLETPVSSTGLTAAEPVTVTMWNYGAQPQTGFQISYSVNGLPRQTETISDTVNPGAGHTFTFVSTADCSMPGMNYEFELVSSLAGDGAPGNDTLRETITNLSTSVGEVSGDDIAVVYPNPGSGDLNIVLLPEAGEITLQIIAVNGELMRQSTRSVRQGQVNLLSMDLNGLPAGVYVLTLSAGTEQQSMKVVRM